MNKKYLCWCDEGDHTIDTKIPAWKLFHSIVKTMGETIIITTPEGSFMVPRIYIAVHGIKTEDLAKLEFPKVKDQIGSELTEPKVATR